MRSTIAEIDLENLSRNIDYLNTLIGERVEVLAVVKANAYGHGSTEMTKTLISLGLSNFGVATLEEASELIEAKIKCNILILGSIHNNEILEAIKENIIFTVYDLDQLNLINRLKNFILNLERINEDLLMVCHTAIARVLIGYYMNINYSELPYQKILLNEKKISFEYNFFLFLINFNLKSDLLTYIYCNILSLDDL